MCFLSLQPLMSFPESLCHLHLHWVSNHRCEHVPESPTLDIISWVSLPPLPSLSLQPQVWMCFLSLQPLTPFPESLRHLRLHWVSNHRCERVSWVSNIWHHFLSLSATSAFTEPQPQVWTCFLSLHLYVISWVSPPPPPLLSLQPQVWMCFLSLHLDVISWVSPPPPPSLSLQPQVWASNKNWKLKSLWSMTEIRAVQSGCLRNRSCPCGDIHATSVWLSRKAVMTTFAATLSLVVRSKQLKSKLSTKCSLEAPNEIPGSRLL